MVRLARAQLQQRGLDHFPVLDHEVEVALLGNRLVGPAVILAVVDPLETDEESVLTSDPGEVSI